uniref:(northern house mosquito) hypothetical protein n=1 Tax=Culex pipiens TaxID=7175 RepID=A0A8D8L6R9_CULPI
MSQFVLRPKTLATLYRGSVGPPNAHRFAALHAGHQEHHSHREAQPELPVRKRASRHSRVSAGNVLHRNRGLPHSAPAVQEAPRAVHGPLAGGFVTGCGHGDRGGID